MKPVIQAIAIADDPGMKIRAMMGLKKITIRNGERDYQIGDVILFEEGNSWAIKAKIVDVQHKKLREVTQEEWEADGFTSQENLLLGMKVFYPEMTLDSDVTVVRWDKVSGYWTMPVNILAFAKVYGIESELRRI